MLFFKKKKTVMHRILPMMLTVVSGLPVSREFLTATQKMALAPCSAGGKGQFDLNPIIFNFKPMLNC